MTNEATWSQSDRTRIQEEINQLMAEIDDQTLRTEFNTRRLLDGSLGSGAAAGGAGGAASAWNAGDAIDFKRLLNMASAAGSVVNLAQNLFHFSTNTAPGQSRNGNTFEMKAENVNAVLRAVLGNEFERNFRVDNDTFAAAFSSKINNALADMIGVSTNAPDAVYDAAVAKWLADQGVYNATPGSEVQTFHHLFERPSNPGNVALYAAHNAVFDALSRIDLSQLVTHVGPADAGVEALFNFNVNNIILSNPGNITDIVGATNAARAALTQFISEKMGPEIHNTYGGGGPSALTNDFVQWLVANGTGGPNANAVAGINLLELFLTGGGANSVDGAGLRGVLDLGDWANLEQFMAAERFSAGWQTASIDQITGRFTAGANAQIQGRPGVTAIDLFGTAGGVNGTAALEVLLNAGLDAGDIMKQGTVIETRTVLLEHSSSAGGTREITLQMFVSVEASTADGTDAVLAWRIVGDSENRATVTSAGLVQSRAGLSDAGIAFREEMIEFINAAIQPFVQDDGATDAGGGGLWFQIGANAGQGVVLNIEAVNVTALSNVGGSAVDAGFTFADLRTADATFASRGQGVLKANGEDISKFLTAVDFALSFTTAQRSNLGAMQNRLEFTIENLQVASENLSSAESRIRDADMAMEMMRFTQSNILQQAAISMLAQANQAPNMILSLLR
jgi:flagellin-like hook-associated protein FlgL